MLSQPARAVTIFCSAARIPHEVVRVRVGRGDTRTPEFVKINPRMRVPVIVDGDFILTESVAIMRYLAREKEVEDHWYPRDSRAQARVDEYLEWQHLNTRLFCAEYFIRRWLGPVTTRPTPDARAVGAAGKRRGALRGQEVAKVLHVLERGDHVHRDPSRVEDRALAPLLPAGFLAGA